MNGTPLRFPSKCSDRIARRGLDSVVDRQEMLEMQSNQQVDRGYCKQVESLAPTRHCVRVSLELQIRYS
ncbi:Uncharacterised protein [Vibrio cholerae]|nr:Uncharacterised protein [Vibrio cholerae]